MKQLLSVIAVIDSPAPATWVLELIDRLEKRDTIQLRLLPLTNDVHELDDTSANSQCSVAERLSQYILLKQIDKPRFSHNPWQRKTLGENASKHLLAACSTALPACDIILNLTTKRLPPALYPEKETPVWDAHLDTLDERVEHALLHQEPLIWMHLWEHSHRQSEHTAAPCKRLATHALPRQSYSLTDLRRAAWFSLPSLFDSRLNWLSLGTTPSIQEHSSNDVGGTACSNTAYADALIQAETLSHQHFRPAQLSGLSRLFRAFQLLFRQNYTRALNRISYEQWQLAMFTKSSGFNPEQRQQALADFTTLPQPDKVWWADPHLFKHKDKLYVFFEEMGIEDPIAHISVATLEENTRELVDVHTVLDEPYHLSYPFVFSNGETIYLIPETASMNKISLYEAETFPTHWKPVKELLQGLNYADTTIHHDGQRWWMFTNAMSHRCVDERDELHLYFADDLLGTWHPHPMNPVLTGVDRARMAGRLFTEGASLYRPSQYGAFRYGYGMNLNRIDVLSTTHYQESTVSRIMPTHGKQWLGCHTISHNHGITLIDRITRRRR